MTGPRVAVIRQTASITIYRALLNGHKTFTVKCRQHGTRQEISEAQAYTVEDSIAFCAKCLRKEAALMRAEEIQLKGR